MLVVPGVHRQVRQERAHPAGRDLERFVRGELRGAEGCRVVRHLLAGCPQCRATARPLWAFADEPLSRNRGEGRNAER